MKVTITGISTHKSKHHNGYFKYVFMKDDSNKRYKTCIDETCRNYKNWEPFLSEGTVLEGLKIKFNDLIDADSKPVLVEPAKPQKQFKLL